jgi:Flp pilus assembly protein TadD
LTGGTAVCCIPHRRLQGWCVEERQEEAFEDGVGDLAAGSASRSKTPDIRARLAQVRQLLEEDRAADAELACRDILTVDPHQHAALAILYRALLRLGRIDEASMLYAQGDWVSKLTSEAQQNLALSLSIAERRQLVKRLSDALTVGNLKGAREIYASAKSEWREDWNI